jgi:uncharacterized protein
MKSALLLMLGYASILMAEDVNILNVTGHCSIKKKSDLAVVTVGVDVLHRNIDSALAAANTVSRKILAVCKKYQISENSIETSQFQVNKKYLDRRDTAVFLGFQIDNQYRIRVQEIAVLNKVLAAIFSIGSNKLEGVDFKLSNEEAIKSACIEKAIGIGKSDAEKMAKASGVKLVKLSKISHENPSYSEYHQPRVGWGASYAYGAAGIDIQGRGPNYNFELVEVIPKEIEITGKVYLTYNIQ